MTVRRRPEVPKTVLTRLRKACLALPEVREEQAWVGTRWRIRKDTFAHVLMIADGWPPVYARAAGTDGPVCVLTFQSLGPRVDPPGLAGLSDRPPSRDLAPDRSQPPRGAPVPGLRCSGLQPAGHAFPWQAPYDTLYTTDAAYWIHNHLP